MPERASLVNLAFKRDGDGTILTLHHEQFFDEPARDRHNEGWTGCLNKLEKFLAISVALSFSAFYEILECVWVFAFYPGQGPEWLGLQGDPWDAQWDMLMALLGAVTAIVCLSRLQDRSIARLPGTAEPRTALG